MSPQLLAGFGVQREEVAFVAAAEDKLAGSGENAGPGLGLELIFPHALAGLGVQRAHAAMAKVAGQVD